MAITVGVAIPVPQPWGKQLDDARAGTGDPLAPYVPSHVTLLGPTEIPDGTLDDVETHLAQVAADYRSFDIYLRGTGTFRPVTEVVFVTVAQGISNCEKLELSVRSGPLERELTYPYHPHVTIAQNVEPHALDTVFEDMSNFEARFHVDGFTLYTHDNESSWRPKQRFTFGG